MIIQGLGEVRSLFCSLYFEEKIAAGRETTTNPGRLRKTKYSNSPILLE